MKVHIPLQMVHFSREEQLKAKGLCSKDITDSEVEKNQANIKLVFPTLKEKESNTEERLKETQMKHGLAQSSRGASSASSERPAFTLEQRQSVNDRDLPPSTPVAPPLNVPIVTHSAQNMEGTIIYVCHTVYSCLQNFNVSNFAVKHLYEEGAVQTRVSFQIHHVLVCKNYAISLFQSKKQPAPRFLLSSLDQRV